MALFGDSAPKSLQDVLGQQAAGQEEDINQGYAKRRKQLIGQEAHNGRLMSGVSEYPLGDLDAAQAGDIAGVESGLASSLGQIPTEDYYNNLDYKRKTELAKYLGGLNKPSTFQEVLGGIGTGAKLASTFAAFA